MYMFIPITPVAKPRQTQSDKWRQRPAVMRYRAFADELRFRLAKEQPLPKHLLLGFYIPIPKSASKKKRAELARTEHLLRPDLDNLIKAATDALYPEDNYISEIHAYKKWAREEDHLGGIEITDLDLYACGLDHHLL